ncbi:MAG: ferrous iron transport protein A [Lentisphaeria bacterium]|nr:ferrous iron transport protein A [Lentisphaeria bacterium]
MNDEKTPAAKTGASARTAPAPSECTLAELPVGRSAVVINMKPSLRGKKKFADVGIVPGTLLEMEAHAPFGGLLRIKVMESSLSIHRDDAANIIIRLQERP